MNILIIGGSRFIGPWVVKNLNQFGHQIAVFNRGKTSVKFPDNIVRIYGDRNKLNDYRDKLINFNPQVVIDMIPFTEKQAELARDVFAGVIEKIITISSMDVYKIYGILIGSEQGEIQTIPSTEESPLRSKLYPYRTENMDEGHIYYHYEKILTERVYLQCSGFSTTVMRLPMVYGPDDGQHRLYEFIKRMEDNRPAIILDNKYAKWKCTRGYVEDIGFAIALAAQEKTAVNQIYNVGETKFLSTYQWINEISKITGWNGKIFTVNPENLPEKLKVEINSDQHLMFNSDKIRNQLGYQETVSRKQALANTIEWERNNPPSKLNQQDFNYQLEDQWLKEKTGDSFA